jgi:hypothetical protein
MPFNRDSHEIARMITRVLLNAVFFIVVGFSLFLADDITWGALMFAITKGVMALFFSWLFFLILSDTIVKSIISNVAQKHELRREGGLIYHFVDPLENEVIQGKELESRKKSGRKS